MPLTLAEQAKLVQTPLQRGVIEVFPRTSPVLERLPFLGVSSNSYRYNQEDTLPGIAFRAIGSGYTESTGVVNPVTESLVILGGASDVDRVLVKTQGNINNIRAIHDGMKAKSAALKFTQTFFKGDSTVDTNSFDGLEKRLTGDQVIDIGTAALTLAKLDSLIDAVIGYPDVIFCNKTMMRKINTLVRAAGQATEVVAGAFGQRLNAYAGIPIAVIEQDETGAEILDFDEGDDTDETSIYACRFGVSEYLSGLQCGALEVIDHGLFSGGTAYRTMIEWICGLAIFHPKAAARLSGITNA